MEGMEGEVYIDNADDNTEMEVGQETEEVSEEWAQLADSILTRAGDSFDWTYDEVDIVTLRECEDIQDESKKREETSLVQCSWCDSVFLSWQMLTRHWLLHHLQWNTNCAVCSGQLNNSVLRHECELECRLCEKTLRSRRRLAKHYYRAHQALYCGLCEDVFNSLQEYRDHVRRENRMLESFCILCKVPMDKSSCSFKEHLMRSHFGPIVISKPTVFEDKTTNHSEVELITHISMKYKPNKTETYLFDNYSCPHCHRKFSAKSGLKIHVGIAHKGGKIIFCSRCPSAFQDVAECKAHFKEEHSVGGRRRGKRKVEATDGNHKSLVPTNLPVEGAETNINVVTVNNNNNVGTVNVEKKKAKKPLPALLKIQDLKEKAAGGGEKEKVKSKKVILSSKDSQGVGAGLMSPSVPVTSQTTVTSQPPQSQPLLVSPVMLPQQPLARSSLSPVTTSSCPRPILPASLGPPPGAPTQVYVPAMTSVGTTILLKLEEAQKHLNNGVVTFLPSSSPPVSSPPVSSPPAPAPPEDTSKPDIMREKVALNLPVVMTKRTNKKLAQDNPFYRVMLRDGHLDGVCRSCDKVFSFKETKDMVSHYQHQHSQTLNIHSFPLYYEINYKIDKGGSKATVKYFLCHFCGKEFTTKFNVRRHQMLYCIRKDEINPKDLGLGKIEEIKEKEEKEEKEEKMEEEISEENIV